jgi:acyl-CoA dehydrogenase
MAWLLFLMVIGVLAYWRASARAWVVGLLGAWIVLAFSKPGFGSVIVLGAIIFFSVMALIPDIRRSLITGRIFNFFKKITPPMSQTEQEAINAGTVWWDKELFSGHPNWSKLLDIPDPHLTKEEQDFMDGPVERVCQAINDWEMQQEFKDLPPEAWNILKEEGFFGMIIKKQYGGLEFSNYAHAKVVSKIATRSGSAGVTVMVPNSLGPGELLQHYGTEDQKNYYLPRLAKGEDIPCFALTSPSAGSDAGSIPDYGVVCKGSYTDPRTGEHYHDVLGMRITWEKRWITLAPVATVLGLAFRLHDPEHLLGDQEDIGITCALIPAEHEGVMIGRRHWPGGSVFMNGPTWGKDVFIPMDWVIGGQSYVGQGWRMLVECLSVGRCISLPAMSVASGKLATFTTGAYARIRDQFGLAIGRFEGVDEALARIAGHTYQMEASQDLALTALDLGEKPSVISAILKYHNTERMRRVMNDAMDIHAGRTVVQGPRNYLASCYQAVPIAITVEGANILTRSMIIYGQGAIRCHPYVLKEMQASMNNDAVAFDEALIGHIGFVISNKVKAFWLGLTGGIWSSSPRQGPMSHYYRQITRFSAAFALLSDVAMALLGGKLKFREKLSARLGDMLSGLYIASASLKRFEREGAKVEDIPVARWAVESALYDVQHAMDTFLNNIPNKFLAFALRWTIFPWGLSLRAPSDRLGTEVSRLMMQPSATRERLTWGIYLPNDEQDPVGVLPIALQAIIDTEALEQKLRKASREGQLKALTAQERLDEALAQNMITSTEYAQIKRARKLKRDVIMVDDFDKKLAHHDENLLDRHIF